MVFQLEEAFYSHYRVRRLHRIMFVTTIRHHLHNEPRIQFTEAEARLVAAAIAKFCHCRLLVFGAGNDSSMWQQLNAGGTTVFLEHNPEWIEKIRSIDAVLDIRPVEYTTRITEWRELLGQRDSLQMDLPQDVRQTRWDVVLVDAPNGFVIADEHPRLGPIHGRMQSIFAASQLAAPNGYIFVHDAQREVENACCEKLLTGSCRELFRFRTRKNNGTSTELRCFSRPSHTGNFSWAELRLQMLAAWLRLRRRPDRQERWHGAMPPEFSA